MDFQSIEYSVNELGFDREQIMFNSMSGSLYVQREGDYLAMDFPDTLVEEVDHSPLLTEALGLPYLELYESKTKVMVVYKDETQIAALKPDFKMLRKVSKNVSVTAKGNDVDFVSRFFAPFSGIDEDPVTGSAHTVLTPYWSKRLNKLSLVARQISQRGGDLYCEMKGNRVSIKGKSVLCMKGQMEI